MKYTRLNVIPAVVLAWGMALAPSGHAEVNSVAGLANPLDNTGGSARATGLGSAFVGVADGSSALLWNPAGLAGLHNLELALHHNSWLAGIVQETAVVALPMGDIGGFGGSVNYVNYGTFSGHDSSGAEVASYSPNRYGFGLGWGTEVLPGISAGIGVKGSMQSVASSSYSAFSVDLGALWIPMKNLRLGFVYSNLGLHVAGFSLASALRVGGSYVLDVITHHQLLLAASTAMEPDGVSRVQVGVEDQMYSMVAVRLGYQANLQDNKITGLTGLALGVGFLYRGFILDYAYLPFGELGTANRISLSYNFGGI